MRLVIKRFHSDLVTYAEPQMVIKEIWNINMCRDLISNGSSKKLKEVRSNVSQSFSLNGYES